MANTLIGQGGATGGTWDNYDTPDGPGFIGGSTAGSKDAGSLNGYQKPTANTNLGTSYSVVRITAGSGQLAILSNPA